MERVKLIDSLDVEDKTALIRVIDSIKEDQTLFLNHYSRFGSPLWSADKLIN